ncbi:Uncharacterized protein BM_BM2363 [Brugia malayi]|uniref:Bm2363, isoform d; Bm2363, isoform e n=2 Tax=Brugia malayi TaxID=6279 RepID=A0A4E9F3H1_BRUMA|nr:Uncharacterized protein BM_BM2363 [Brugia malayi]VIO88881.1 Uncharacterized protein BM_BM2363 [Brugia malayi]
MSTSERPLVLTRSATHQQQRLSTELAITTSSGSLPSSTHAITVTTKSTSVTFQKPFSNFIDIIVAAFTALLLAWRLLLPKSDEVAVDLNGKKDHHGSSIKDIGGISANAVSTTTSVAATAMESVPSIESLRALLSTDDQLVTTGHQQPFLTEAQFVTQCSSSQDIEYFLRYGTDTYNTERCLLAIPELDEENNELCGSQWSSLSSVRTPTDIHNTKFVSEISIRSVSPNSDQSISSDTYTGHAPDLINYNKSSNPSSVNLIKNSDPEVFSLNQAIFTDSSAHPTVLSHPASKFVLTVPHPTIPPLSSLKPLLPSLSTSPLYQPKEICDGNSSLPLPLSPVAATTTAGHLTFDIPGLPAIDSEDSDNNSQINLEILHETPINTVIIAYNLNSDSGNYSNKLMNFTQQNKMKRVTDTISQISSIPNSSLLDHSNCRDRDQNEIVINGLLDAITNEETCSLNSTSISIDHSRDSILDFSICSNPIDEAAIMEEQLAATGELNDDVPSLVDTLSSGVSKDNRHWLTNRTISTTVTAVASTTNNNRQPVLPTSSALASASFQPFLFSAPPIASLEDLTNGERNSDVTSTRNNAASASIASVDCNEISKSDLRGRGRIVQGVGSGKDGDDGDNDDVSGRSDYYRQTSAASTTIKRYIIRSGMSSPPSEPPPPPPPRTPSELSSQKLRSSDMSRDDDIHAQRSEHRSRTIREIPVQRTTSSIPSSTITPIDYRSTATPFSDYHQEEYYRKEIRTRTFVTRSSEALSAPPLSRSSPIILERERYPSVDNKYYPREERTVDYNYKYLRSLEEEERRIKKDQEQRQREEEDRRKRAEEERRLWEAKEREYLERKRREREIKHRELESERLERERLEKQRLDKERAARENVELQRRAEWERLERARREHEEYELQRWRELEKSRLEQERLEDERRERERLDRERAERERERLAREQAEKERLECERLERERIETERLEIERIERIKRERQERERQEREKEKEEQERFERERQEQERIIREKQELLRVEEELLEMQRREAQMREAERIEEENREARRREEERREAEIIAEMQREAEEREMQRRLSERLEKERLENLRREQERLDREKQEAEVKELQRQEEERREKELFEAQKLAAERREQERREDEERERQRQEEERIEAEKRERERREAVRRERERQIEEKMEREKLAAIRSAAQERHAARLAEIHRDEQRQALEREANELQERERQEAERRERERVEEDRRLKQLLEQEKRNSELREQERQEALEREAQRRLEDRRSRDKLDQIAREIEEKEKMEMEKRHLLMQITSRDRRKDILTSRETLEKLTKPPYYSRENLAAISCGSRENLSSGGNEVTTKVERQVIERIDRTVWSDDPRYTQNNISNGSDSSMLTRERLYSRRSADDDDFSRSSSRRTSRYRSKLEKARKEFLSSDANNASDAISERFRQTSDDILRSRSEYHGPLYEKPQRNEFSSKHELNQLPYNSIGPSPYDQVEETNLDDVHRSGSVMDYNRFSRRDAPQSIVSHVRSKSADYLMDRKMREESAPPENELQKFCEKTPNVSEHELRFRKSTEKLHVPDWYRERHIGRSHEGRAVPSGTSFGPLSPASHNGFRATTTQYETSETRYITPFCHEVGGCNAPAQIVPLSGPSTSGAATAVIPYGMFDKYKHEIEEMRRSRTSLNQVGSNNDKRKEQECNSFSNERNSLFLVSMNNEKLSSIGLTSIKQLPGYTVTTVPSNWNIPDDRNSRVVEVADTFIGSNRPSSPHNDTYLQRFYGRITIEEVLDSIFQRTKPSSTRHKISLSEGKINEDGQVQKSGIYVKSNELMQQLVQDPYEAEALLQNERLYVRCAQCHQTRELAEARMQYISCKHCYTYYCSRQCREYDWSKHREVCSFSRINTLCKKVIMKVRKDSETQFYMSKIARDGYSALGRGSVNLRINSTHTAQNYIMDGWSAIANFQLNKLLHYYTIAALIAERKEPSLITLCRQYDPTDKFILSVSIIADIEQCPQTPPPEPVVIRSTLPQSQNARQSSLCPQQSAEQNFIQSDVFRSAVPTEV